MIKQFCSTTAQSVCISSFCCKNKSSGIMMLLVFGRDPFLIISNICFDLFVPPSPLTPLLLLGFHTVKLETLSSIHVGMWLLDLLIVKQGEQEPVVCFTLSRSCWAQAGLKLQCQEGCWPCCSLLHFYLILIAVNTKSICKRVWECVYIHNAYLHKYIYSHSVISSQVWWASLSTFM